MLRALLLQRQQPALDGAHRRAVDIAVLRLEAFGVVADVLRHRAQIFEVEQQQPLIVGDAEDNLQHAALDLVEIQQARQQQRAEIGNGGAHRMTLFAEDIPQHHRTALRLPVGDADLRQPRQQFLALLASRRDAGQVAFHVRHKYRHADRGERFRQLLQRYGFAGTGRAGD